MKMRVDVDELYPFFWADEPWGSDDGDEELFDFTPDEVARINSAMVEFDWMQGLLRSKMKWDSR